MSRSLQVRGTLRRGNRTGRAWALAATALLMASCATDAAPGPEPDGIPAVADQLTPSNPAATELPQLRQTAQASIDLAENDPMVNAFAGATRAERHARAQEFYDMAYNGGDLGGRTLVFVTSLDDSGPGTLREAIDNSQANGTVIAFNPQIFGPFGTGVIRLQSPLLGPGPFPSGPGVSGFSDVIIVAPEPGVVAIDGDSDDDGDGDTVLFDWMRTSSSRFRMLTLVGLELRNGFSDDGDKSPVVKNGGPLVMVDCYVHDNEAVDSLASLGFCNTTFSAAVSQHSSGTDPTGLAVFRSVFENNRTNCEGGAISLDSGVIAESIFAGNQAGLIGGAITQWQSINDGILIDSSTFIDNTAGTRGGAVEFEGRFNEIVQSVFARNSAPTGPDFNGILQNVTRSTFTSARGTNAISVDGGNNFFDERPLTIGARELLTDRSPFPYVEPLFCSAAVDLADPSDPNTRDITGSDRPFDLSIGAPATNVSDSGAVEAEVEFPPCPYTPPTITGTPAVGNNAVRATVEEWRHPYGSTPGTVWQRCTDGTGTSCTDISGSEDLLTYTMVDGDLGFFIRYVTRLDNQVDSAAMNSNLIGPVLGTPPSFNGTPSVTGPRERCGNLFLQLPPLLGSPAPDLDSASITWEVCDSVDACTTIATDTRSVTLGLDSVGLRLQVRIQLSTVSGTLNERVVVGIIEDVPAPTCTVSEVELVGGDLQLSGTFETSGSCFLAGLGFSPTGTQPSFDGINADEGGTFTAVINPGPLPLSIDCFVADNGGRESTTTYTGRSDDCNQLGACDPVTRVCSQQLDVGTPCGPGQTACEPSFCDAAGACVVSPLNCDDGNPCTQDLCDPQRGCLVPGPPASGPCNDGNACTTGDSCEAGVCVPGSPVVCDASGPCVTAACNPVNGVCEEGNVADNTSCADNDGCNGVETCQAGVCTSGSDLDCEALLEPGPCQTAVCDPVGGCSLVDVADDTPCNTDTICGGSCTTGVCEGGVAIDCASDDPCLEGVCDDAAFECVFTPIAGCGEDVGPDAGPDAGPDVVDEDVTPDVDSGPDAADIQEEVDTDVEADTQIVPDTVADTADVDTTPSEDTSPEPQDGEALLAGSGILGCSAAPSSPLSPAAPSWPALLLPALGALALTRRR